MTRERTMEDYGERYVDNYTGIISRRHYMSAENGGSIFYNLK